MPSKSIKSAAAGRQTGENLCGFSRREMLKCTAAAALFGLVPRELRANPLGLPIGVQTYRVREMVSTDFPGAVKMLSSIGFQTIELCSPKGYADDGFGPVGKYKGPDLKKMLASFNISCHSSHFSIQELREDLPGSIGWAKSVGLTQMMVPSLEGPEKPTMDDVKKAADEFNKMGRQVKEAGLLLGLHNEGFEVSKVNGENTYDVLIGLLDPQFTTLQFQCSTLADGFVAADYFTRYPGRFISMHVQDWSSAAKKEVTLGQGDIDWKKTFAAAKVGGIKNYFVEMDLPLMKASIPYLHQLNV